MLNGRGCAYSAAAEGFLTRPSQPRLAIGVPDAASGKGTASSMELRLRLDMLQQPDETTCGPTCLHAIYHYFNDLLPLQQIIDEVPRLAEGGTLAVHLAVHALKRGYHATIYTYNVTLFDPTWFGPNAPDMAQRLRAQMEAKPGERLRVATQAYLEFLDLGGKLQFEDLTTGLIRKHLTHDVPILTGLSATYLYRTAREKGSRMDYDDVQGEPSGHFVVLCGYDRGERAVLVADPLLPNPMSQNNQYAVNIDRLVCSILLGTLTFDDNLLIIKPSPKPAP